MLWYANQKACDRLWLMITTWQMLLFHFSLSILCINLIHWKTFLNILGTVQIYPIYEDIPERKNHADTINQAQLAQATKNSLFGVFATSPLHNVVCIPDSLILDYTHFVLKGEFVWWLSIWLNHQGKSGVLAKHIVPLADKMGKIKLKVTTISWFQKMEG